MKNQIAVLLGGFLLFMSVVSPAQIVTRAQVIGGSNPWLVVGPLNSPVTVPDLRRCNLRLALHFVDPATSAPLTSHFYLKQDFLNSSTPNYATFVFDLNYTAVATLNQAGLFAPQFFLDYVTRLANPQERPLEAQIDVGLNLANGQTNVTCWYRYIDSNGSFHGPIAFINSAQLILEKQCP